MRALCAQCALCAYGEFIRYGIINTWNNKDTVTIRVPKLIATQVMELAHRLDYGEIIELDTESKNPNNDCVIQSNFPIGMMTYQAVTIFGANHPDRAAFAKALPRNSIQVWPLPQN